ncbi:helicase [Thermocrinis sp.]|uniref:C-terminal helicase domain-containing protein n=1 Tax=Thermocrinis sp. TaxID=2024383 RepID=UPI002FDCA68A
MGSVKSQFLGYVFEGAFKLGFLKDKIVDYEDFKKKGVFLYVAQKYEYVLEDLVRAWMELEEIVPDRLEELRELGIGDYTDKKLLYFLFLTGFYEGLFFGGQFEKSHLIKYAIGEEAEAGRYLNADLIFIDGSALYVVDFKLGGAQHKAKYILSGQEENIPFRTPGVPINLSLGEMSLEGFLDSLIRLEDKLLNLQSVNPEIKGFLQTLSYAVDYLCEEKPEKNLSEINVFLLYPLAEPFCARFYWKGENLNQYREQIKEIYHKFSEKDWSFSALEKPSAVRFERIHNETFRKIEELNEKIRQLESQEDEIETTNKEVPRLDVEERIREFLKEKDGVKALCLLHSAGSGKTSKTRDAILELEGNHIVFYMATRKVLLSREKEKLEAKNVAVVYEERDTKNSKFVEHIGDTFKHTQVSPGIIKRTVEQVKMLAENGHRFIWALCTQQALTTTENGKSTAEHMKYLITPRIIDKYNLHIILDEFLGYSNGLFAIEQMFKLIKKAQGKAKLYIFDANGYSASIMKKLLEEYKEFQVMPDAIVVCDYKESEIFEHEGIKVYVHTKHGYPSPKIILKRKFINLLSVKNKREMEEKVAKEVVNYIKSTADKNSTAFVYVQDKSILYKINEMLEKEGLKTLIATAESRKSQERINKGDEDVLLSTSTLSRGIDLSREHKPINQIYVIIHSWGIESNLVELIQTISRARGDDITEKSDKKIHLIYLVHFWESATDSILEYIDEEVDRDLINLLLHRQALEQILELDHVVSTIIAQFVKSPESEKMVLIPIPKQYKTQYIPNPIAEIEETLSFIENIRRLTKEENLQRLYELILKAMSVSAVKIDFKNSYSYYHPYILFERQEVRTYFEDRLRGNIYNLFKKVEGILKEHNEEKADLAKKRIMNFLDTETKMPVLIPVYSYVLTKHILRKNEKLRFEISKTVGRGGADTVLGSTRPTTYCFKGENIPDEYACIPLGEDYPYKEVLSGRFAKFPVEFIRRLLNG